MKTKKTYYKVEINDRNQIKTHRLDLTEQKSIVEKALEVRGIKLRDNLVYRTHAGKCVYRPGVIHQNRFYPAPMKIGRVLFIGAKSSWDDYDYPTSTIQCEIETSLENEENETSKFVKYEKLVVSGDFPLYSFEIFINTINGYLAKGYLLEDLCEKSIGEYLKQESKWGAWSKNQKIETWIPLLLQLEIQWETKCIPRRVGSDSDDKYKHQVIISWWPFHGNWKWIKIRYALHAFGLYTHNDSAEIVELEIDGRRRKGIKFRREFDMKMSDSEFKICLFEKLSQRLKSDESDLVYRKFQGKFCWRYNYRNTVLELG